MIVHPLFQEEDDGLIPISPLQFQIGRMSSKQARNLNYLWHSRLPELKNWQMCEAYGATYCNRYYAVAFWSHPVARLLNDKGLWELRRLAICNDAPKNTASRMLKIMRKLITKAHPSIRKLISYQDTAVHQGTIYRASGWVKCDMSGTHSNGDWGGSSKLRKTAKSVAVGQKQRWEYDIKNKAPKKEALI